MNFLCPGVKAEDCVVDDRGRNSCDGPCNFSLNNDLQSRVFQMFPNRIVNWRQAKCGGRQHALREQITWGPKTQVKNSKQFPGFDYFYFICFLWKSNFPSHRMLRVRNDSCEIHEKFHGAIQVTLKWYKTKFLINPIHAGVFLVLLFKIHVAPRVA